MGGVQGHHVTARLALDPTLGPDRRVPPIADGNRSLVFRFDSLDEDSREPVNLGAVIRQSGTAGTGTTGIVELHFWADLAAVYAKKGTPFLLWYGEIVGRGEIVDVLEPADGEALPGVAVDLTPEERRLLIAGIGDWGGPTSCTDSVAQLMGFADVEGLYRDGRGLRERLKFEEPLTARDWGRALLATELCFASSFGSTIDWEITTGIRDAEAIALLRSLQHKLGGMVKQVAVR